MSKDFMVTIEVNGSEVKAYRGETILEALERNGLTVPTLCHMKSFLPSGSCRMCVVEVNGSQNLVTSCSQPVEEWMKIETHSQRVLKARQTIIDLLLASHPDDCLYCLKNSDCELRKLAAVYSPESRKLLAVPHRKKVDSSSPAMVRDLGKCIKCGRCVRICDEVQECYSLDFSGRGQDMELQTSFARPLNVSNCVLCGQCVLVCPTAALTEKDSTVKVREALAGRNNPCVLQYSVTAARMLADAMGIKSSKDITEWMAGLGKKLGFSKVVLDADGTDIAVHNTALFFADAFTKGKGPVISSDCPSWVKFAEQNYPEYLENLVPLHSPVLQASENIRKVSEDAYIVGLLPCLSAKFEPGSANAILSPREMMRLMQLSGIDASFSYTVKKDEMPGIHSSASLLAGISGGSTVSVMRCALPGLSVKGPDMKVLDELLTFKTRKEVFVKLGKQKIGIAAVSGLAEARKIMKELRDGRNDLHFIEVMACPFGCINGGGQCFGGAEDKIRQRHKVVCEAEEREMIRIASKNPVIKGVSGLDEADFRVFRKRDVLL